MFTIKHIGRNEEHLFSVESAGIKVDTEGCRKLYALLIPMGLLEINTGTVYVMNESGATVAKYEFPPVNTRPAPAAD